MITREGRPFIVFGSVVTTILVVAALRWDSWWLFGVGVLFALLTLFITFFFRDPPRHIAAEPNLLVSPADGKVLGIQTLENYPHVGDRALKVSIFMSILDAHINRVPATGTVDYVKYNPGKFFPAFKDKASEQNEQTEIGMTTTGDHRIVFKQIAGIIARRIVCKLQKGDFVSVGARFGMIRFGSRAELFIPADSELRVKSGDHVKGGQTIIGYLPARSTKTTFQETAKGDNAKL